MALKSRKMAELNPESDAKKIAAAATIMSLGTGRRLARNFSYYNRSDADVVSRRELQSLLLKIRRNSYNLENLYLHDEISAENGVFKVMLAKNILDEFEELHRKVLFFDPDKIQHIIPIIDRQRSFWKQSEDIEFYSNGLTEKLEHDVSADLLEIGSFLKELPEISSN